MHCTDWREEGTFKHDHMYLKTYGLQRDIPFARHACLKRYEAMGEKEGEFGTTLTKTKTFLVIIVSKLSSNYEPNNGTKPFLLQQISGHVLETS